MLSAPVLSRAPGTSADVTETEPTGAEPADGTPIFESVRSGYPHAFARQASVAESAEITRSRLASFQRGSRRARTVARSAKQPVQDAGTG